MTQAVRWRKLDERLTEVITPEGVPLNFCVATAGARALAFVTDFVILFAIMIGFLIGAAGVGFSFGGWGIAMMTVVWFLLANFWFTFFEIRWHGRTIGKRLAKIRVIGRGGGELKASAVFARNFMREIELWIPLKVILAGQMIYADLPGWAIPLSILWAFVLLFMPAFNRDRLRLGDMVGGTLVVRDPKERLREDLSAAPTKDEEYIPAFLFSREQLDIYGIYELQVLETLLRGRAKAEKQNLNVVAQKIATKINWGHPIPKRATRTFLEDFYRAQRDRLEKKALFGQRQEFKKGVEDS